ncbi:MAG: hypothetical protein BAA01_09190 [Bacillus thermozeamaize]|uniref:Uncharacterized protein n=1 Tax=Bacillus thermozeamaize TaxID=230954 RepID=A0A1Y3PE95_9BACI|nr:MAG: hypothetical protein BAA01_09190 [Bacillus thermozeamaize]
MRTLAVIGGIVGLMMVPAIRRRTLMRLLNIPMVSNLAVRSVVGNRWIRNQLFRRTLTPMLRAMR